MESCAKYSDYLEYNLEFVSEYQSRDEPKEGTNLTEFPACSPESVHDLYASKRDRDLVEIIRNNLEVANDYEAINIDKHLNIVYV